VIATTAFFVPSSWIVVLTVIFAPLAIRQYRRLA